MLFLARAWCTISRARRCSRFGAPGSVAASSLSMLFVEKPVLVGSPPAGRRWGHPGPNGYSQVTIWPREETNAAHSAPGCVPPIRLASRPFGLKFGHRWVYAGWISTRCGHLKLRQLGAARSIPIQSCCAREPPQAVQSLKLQPPSQIGEGKTGLPFHSTCVSCRCVMC